MKDIQHILRVGVTFVVVTGLFLVVRSFLVPESYGRMGHYRADAVKEIKALDIKYVGEKECANCHPAKAKEKKLSPHRGISCESCHGAAHEHLKDPAKAKPILIMPDQARKFCRRCHEENISRPKGFAQVNMHTHNPGLACTGCHNPHSPKL